MKQGEESCNCTYEREPKWSNNETAEEMEKRRVRLLTLPPLLVTSYGIKITKNTTQTRTLNIIITQSYKAQ